MMGAQIKVFEMMLHDYVKNEAWMNMGKMEDVYVSYPILQKMIKDAKKVK